jgi:hypothetical protein
MALATWWRGDSVPALSFLPDFRVEASQDEHLIAEINRLAPDEVHQHSPSGKATASIHGSCSTF